MLKVHYVDVYGCRATITELPDGSFQAQSWNAAMAPIRDSNHTEFKYALRALKKDTDGLTEVRNEGLDPVGTQIKINNLYKEHTDQMLEKIYFDLLLKRQDGLVSELIGPGATQLRNILHNVPSLGQCVEMAEKKLLDEIAQRYFKLINADPMKAFTRTSTTISSNHT